MSIHFNPAPQTTRHTVDCDDCEGHGSRCVGFDDRIIKCEACNGEGFWTACDYCGEADCICEASDFILDIPVHNLGNGRFQVQA